MESARSLYSVSIFVGLVTVQKNDSSIYLFLLNSNYLLFVSMYNQLLIVYNILNIHKAWDYICPIVCWIQCLKYNLI